MKKIENFIIKYIRYFAVGIVLISVALLSISTIELFNTKPSTHINLEDVIDDLSSELEEVQLLDTNKINIIESALATEENIEVFHKWVKSLEEEERKTDFIDNLAEVILDFESNYANGDIHFEDIINTYKDEKFAAYSNEDINSFQYQVEEFIYQVKFGTKLLFILLSVITLLLIGIYNTEK